MQQSRAIIRIKKWGNFLILAAIIIELLIWPSIANLTGCGMTWICWNVFSRLGLNETHIREHFFGWLVFLSMSLYRILPLLATMLEGHSIGYNFVVPIATYIGETILYLISALAFYWAVNCKNALSGLKTFLDKCGFYARISDRQVWLLGFIGLIINVYIMSAHVQIGDVVGKTLQGFTFFQYAPFMLFFPALYQKRQNNCRIIIFNKLGGVYFLFTILLAFATNSRYAILEPFGTFALLFFLSYIQYPLELRSKIGKKYIVFGLLAIVFVIPFVSDVSLAMLANRNIRDSVSKTELFSKTIDTYFDDDKMATLRKMKEITGIKVIRENKEEWSEKYVDNFALNRYCNMRVTDNTLYHAQKVGFANLEMYANFWNDIIVLLPTPILNFLKITHNKNERYSHGDMLKSLSTGHTIFKSYLVTSHLADGLVTFGYLYFPIEFILFFFRFLFLDTFLIKRGHRIFYSIFGLITIFSFLAMFRNAGGCCDSLPYLLRGYWQNIILYLIGFFFLMKTPFIRI